MKFQHKQQSEGCFCELSLVDQLANIGGEVERAIQWKPKNNDYSRKAIERALELLYFSIRDVKNRTRLKELTRLRETLIDYFYFDNNYSSSDRLWRTYFKPFYFAARKE
jgi:hypothetical protein